MNWEIEWQNAVGSMNEVSTVRYWNKRAEDYDDFIRTSRFSYGEEIVKILMDASFLERDMSVFEIAGGVGALTLPLCRNSRHVTTVEPAKKMVEKLSRNAQHHDIHNVTILAETCQETALRHDLPLHDAAVMCHASWQFPDLRWLIEFMEKTGNGRACLADSVPNTDNTKKAFYRELGISHHSFDRLHALHEALWAFERNPELQLFPFTMRRSSESARAMITQVLGKYRQPETKDLIKISDFVEEHSHSGIYEEKASMGVIWWRKAQ